MHILLGLLLNFPLLSFFIILFGFVLVNTCSSGLLRWVTVSVLNVSATVKKKQVWRVSKPKGNHVDWLFMVLNYFIFEWAFFNYWCLNQPYKLLLLVRLPTWHFNCSWFTKYLDILPFFVFRKVLRYFCLIFPASWANGLKNYWIELGNRTILNYSTG